MDCSSVPFHFLLVNITLHSSSSLKSEVISHLGSLLSAPGLLEQMKEEGYPRGDGTQYFWSLVLFLCLLFWHISKGNVPGVGCCLLWPVYNSGAEL